MGDGWAATIFTQLCFAQLWVNGGGKAMGFGWAAAGQPQFSYSQAE